MSTIPRNLRRCVCLQVGIAFVDKDYPARAAFGIVAKVLDEYSDQTKDAWRTAMADTNDAVLMLEAAVSKYQVEYFVSLPLCAPTPLEALPKDCAQIVPCCI